MSHYQRIACLSTESVETLYALVRKTALPGFPALPSTRLARAKRSPRSAAFPRQSSSAFWQSSQIWRLAFAIFKPISAEIWRRLALKSTCSTSIR